MNQPPKPDDSVDTFTTFQSVPAPPSAPMVSIRVPSLTPGGAPIEVPAPPGAQVVIPGAYLPIAHVVFKFAIPVTCVIVCAVLVAMGKMDSGYLKALIGLVFGIQMPSISLHEPHTVLATVPKTGGP